MRLNMVLFLGFFVGVAAAHAAMATWPQGPLTPAAFAQVGAPSRVDPRFTTYSWSAPEAREDGSPVGGPLSYEVAYWPAGVEIATAEPAGTFEAAASTATLSMVPEGTPPGEYQISVRAVDAGGLISGWAPAIVQTWEFDPSPPAPVTLWRVTLVGRSDGSIVWEEPE